MHPNLSLHADREAVAELLREVPDKFEPPLIHSCRHHRSPSSWESETAL